MTQKRVVALVGLLPRGVQRELALGPVPQDADHPPGGCCRACAATAKLRALILGEVRATEAAWTRRWWKRLHAVYVLHNWHRGADLAARRDALEMVGVWTPEFVLGEGEECFERSCMIYRAAGWQAGGSGTLPVIPTKEANVETNQPSPESPAEGEDMPLREEDVMREDGMDDRVEDGDLPGDDE